MSTTEPEEKKRARETVNAIVQLRRCPAFSGYHQERLKEKVRSKKEEILYNDKLSAEEMRDARTALRTLEEIAQMVDADDAANRNILGIKPDETAD